MAKNKNRTSQEGLMVLGWEAGLQGIKGKPRSDSEL